MIKLWGGSDLVEHPLDLAHRARRKHEPRIAITGLLLQHQGDRRIEQGPALAGLAALGVELFELLTIGNGDRLAAVGEHVIEHLLELQGRLMGHVLPHALREFAGIQGLHREGKQLVGGFDAPVGSRAPQQAGIRRGLPRELLNVGVDPRHHRIEIEQGVARAIAHHLPQRCISPAGGCGQKLGIKRLFRDWDRPGGRHRASQRACQRGGLESAPGRRHRSHQRKQPTQQQRQQ